MQRRARNPSFGRQSRGEANSGDVSEALLRQTRKSGQLNLSNRGLTVVPDKVWRVNLDVPPEARNVSLDATDDDKWWEIVDLTKLILASNKLTEISSEISQFPALAVLDVSIDVCKVKNYFGYGFFVAFSNYFNIPPPLPGKPREFELLKIKSDLKLN